jgi:hypothetical protein
MCCEFIHFKFIHLGSQDRLFAGLYLRFYAPNKEKIPLIESAKKVVFMDGKLISKLISIPTIHGF